jgi:hypothetical protein
VSKFVSKITINEITEERSNELIRNEEDQPRLRLFSPTDLIRYTADIDFVRCDPGILHLVTGVPLAYNADGDVTGFDYNTRLPMKAFALEVWSKITGSACEDGTRQWGRTTMPFLKGGYVSGFSFTPDGRVSFNLRNAKMQRAPKWAKGPYGDEPDLPAVSRNLMIRTYLSSVQPPVTEEGIIEVLEPVIDNGDAFDPGTGTLDGQFVVTSSDVVDGGGAS